MCGFLDVGITGQPSAPLRGSDGWPVDQSISRGLNLGRMYCRHAILVLEIQASTYEFS
jgi:hypothetical protein